MLTIVTCLTCISFIVFALLTSGFYKKYRDLLVLISILNPVIDGLRTELEALVRFKQLTITLTDRNIKEISDLETQINIMASNIGIIALAIDLTTGMVPIGHRLAYLESTVLSDPKFQMIYNTVLNPSQNEIGV